MAASVNFFFFTVNAISSLMLIFALIGQGNFYISFLKFKGY